MIRKILLGLLAVYVLAGCGFIWKEGGPPVGERGQPPRIVDFHAEEVIRPGETWKVYLKLRDVDCDMTYVVTQVWQSGAGSYPSSFTPIREIACPELVGYIFLRTSSDRSLVWNQYDVNVFVRDRQGHQSNAIKLPLNFDWVSSKEAPDRWQSVTVVSIGAISIDLLNTFKSDTGR